MVEPKKNIILVGGSVITSNNIKIGERAKFLTTTA
tara:strand:+ start:313 stop:417 length:105 start_codon:yes stop_codon:yes gene_type:complete